MMKENTIRMLNSRTDRDYLYGRLFAIAKTAVDLSGMDLSSVYCNVENFRKKPYCYWEKFHEDMMACMKFLKPEQKKVLSEQLRVVMNRFQNGDYENNDPLTATYCLGAAHEESYLDELIH